SPKSGTVTFEIAKAVSELKNGRFEYKNDSLGIIHASVGKVSFDVEKVVCNINALIKAIANARPASVKGKYIKNISISSTMGPGIFIAEN
ncbi:MAG: 50S ribosomal protein L1, partial [Endomicrobium sp.]|nr:50S ribosomal protein L1 [Endomicrobium sp.]